MAQEHPGKPSLVAKPAIRKVGTERAARAREQEDAPGSSMVSKEARRPVEGPNRIARSLREERDVLEAVLASEIREEGPGGFLDRPALGDPRERSVVLERVRVATEQKIAIPKALP